MLTFSNCGIETAVVDRAAKKERIKQWTQSSVIEEEDEGNSCNEETSDKMPNVSRRSSSDTEENELYALTTTKRDV